MRIANHTCTSGFPIITNKDCIENKCILCNQILCYHCDLPVVASTAGKDPLQRLVRTELNDAAFGCVERAAMHKSCGDLYADPRKKDAQMQRLKIRKVEPLHAHHLHRSVRIARALSSSTGTDPDPDPDAYADMPNLISAIRSIPNGPQIAIVPFQEGFLVRISRPSNANGASANANTNASENADPDPDPDDDSDSDSESESESEE